VHCSVLGHSLRGKVPGHRTGYSSIERRRQQAELSSAPTHHAVAISPSSFSVSKGKTNCSTVPFGILIPDLVTFLPAGMMYRCLSKNACTSQIQSMGSETGHTYACSDLAAGMTIRKVCVVVCGDACADQVMHGMVRSTGAAIGTARNLTVAERRGRR